MSSSEVEPGRVPTHNVPAPGQTLSCAPVEGLSNAMSDLRSWLPGYDGDSDTMPWERGEDPESPNGDEVQS